MVQIVLFLMALWPQDQERPLPELSGFLSEFRQTLRRDSELLSRYTYTETEREITLDSGGNAKKTETNVYQVFHGAEEWQTYRRHISRNGAPVPAKELDKHDAEEKKRVEKELRKRGTQSETRRRQEREKKDREEARTIAESFALYDIRMMRRETLDGQAAILLTFNPKPGYKPATREGRILQHISGRAWVAESDHQLVKLEAEVIDPISLGAGLLAKLKKGSALSFTRRKVNDEIWLPIRSEASISGRLLLFKGLNLRQITEYSDHRKYSVDTILTFGDPIRKPER